VKPPQSLQKVRDRHRKELELMYQQELTKQEFVD